jgi:hypothetical protein
MQDETPEVVQVDPTESLELRKGRPVAGRGKGKLIIHEDDDEHLEDFVEYMP